MSVKSWPLPSNAHSNARTIVSLVASFSKSQQTKSILKTISSRFPTAPEAADTKARSPFPELPSQFEDSESDKKRGGGDEHARCGRAQDGEGRPKGAAKGGIEGA